MILNKKLNFEINIFGLGYVGLTLAAKLLNNGINVNGFEINDKILYLLKKKESSFYRTTNK